MDGDGLRWLLDPLATELDVIIPDQRGHGRSDLASAVTWELDEWADDLACVIDALSLNKPVVFGISCGGWVALRYASRHAGQAGGLIVAGQTGRLLSTVQVGERMLALGGPASKRAWLRSQHGHADGPQDFARYCSPLMSVRQAPESLAAVRQAQVRTQQVNDHFTPQFERLDLTEDASSITVPFTLILGEQDPTRRLNWPS